PRFHFESVLTGSGPWSTSFRTEPFDAMSTRLHHGGGGYLDASAITPGQGAMVHLLSMDGTSTYMRSRRESGSFVLNELG
ncbi:MAG: hypothetical protein K1X67_12405, partial [Fimbriimonadaceae bacterium]|nr:hypothetical protein [Fimbriimonadaceae bacterium]